MIITCKNCNTSFNLIDELVKDTGSKVKCSKCSYIFQVFPVQVEKESDEQYLDLSRELDKDLSDKDQFSFDRQEAETKSSIYQSDTPDDLDLAEIEKILQEEEGKTFNGDLLEQDDHHEDFENFELDDLDDLFDKTDDFTERQLEMDSSLKESDIDFQLEEDPSVLSDSEEATDIDLSQLDELFGEEDNRSLEPLLSDEESGDIQIDDAEILAFDQFFDGKEEISLEEKPGRKAEDINLSEMDLIFPNETEEELDFNFDTEAAKDDDTEKLSEKIDDTIDFEFDFDSESELKKDVNAGDDIDFDFDFDSESEEKNKDMIDEKIDFDFDLDLEMEKDSTDHQKDFESPEELELDFDIQDHDKMDETADFEEEFDLSDLEEIIDLEEESIYNSKPLKSTDKSEEQEDDFDFALEPDLEDGNSPALILEEEDSDPEIFKKPLKAESPFPEDTEESESEFRMADDREEAFLIGKDDYHLDEAEGKFQKVFKPMTIPEQVINEEPEDDPGIEEEGSKSKSRFGKIVLVALVLAILAAAGYGVVNILNISGSKLPIIGSFLKPETHDSGNVKLVALDLNSKFDQNNHAGKIFVITGTIKNEYSEPRSFVKITGRLYEPAKKLSHTEQVYAGNVFSDLELRNLDMEAIKKRLSDRFGQNRSNVNIQPGQTVPFMIIFSMLPQHLEEFTIEIESSSPA